MQSCEIDCPSYGGRRGDGEEGTSRKDYLYYWNFPNEMLA